MAEFCSKILPQEEGAGGLYLGSVQAAEDIEFLSLKGITTVLTIAANLQVKSIQNRFVVEVEDHETQRLIKCFDQTFKRIEEGRAKGSVLVHCFKGVSRSAAVVMAYLMRKQGLGYKAAHNFVKQKRKQANPNPAFIAQLKQYEAVIANN